MYKPNNINTIYRTIIGISNLFIIIQLVRNFTRVLFTAIVFYLFELFTLSSILP